MLRGVKSGLHGGREISISLTENVGLTIVIESIDVWQAASSCWNQVLIVAILGIASSGNEYLSNIPINKSVMLGSSKSSEKKELIFFCLALVLDISIFNIRFSSNESFFGSLTHSNGNNTHPTNLAKHGMQMARHKVALKLNECQYLTTLDSLFRALFSPRQKRNVHVLLGFVDVLAIIIASAF